MSRSLPSLLLAVGLLAAVAYVPATAKADAAPSAIAPFSTITSLDLVSKYVWRGIPERGSGPSLQPSLTLAVDAGEVGSFSANWWGDWDTTTEHNTNNKRFTEHDWTATWSKSFDKLTLTSGAIYYYFPQVTPRQETEVFNTVSYSGWWLVPTLAVYYGFRAENGFYANLSVAHTFDLKSVTDGLSLTFAVAQGAATSNWEKANTGVHTNAFHDFGAKATLAYAITKNLTTSLYLAESSLIDNKVRDQAKMARDRNADNLIGGVNLTFAY